jgi:hypothetical protein
MACRIGRTLNYGLEDSAHAHAFKQLGATAVWLPVSPFWKIPSSKDAETDHFGIKMISPKRYHDLAVRRSIRPPCANVSHAWNAEMGKTLG